MKEPNRPTRLGWLVTYIGTLLRTGYTGRIQFTLDFNRGGISHLRVAELKEVKVVLRDERPGRSEP
jgi:hypothetical protein